MTKKQRKMIEVRRLNAANALAILNGTPRRFMDAEGKIEATPEQYENAPFELIYVPSNPVKGFKK